METLDNNLTGQDGMRLNSADRGFIIEMAKWARFISIVGFIFLGLGALGLLTGFTQAAMYEEIYSELGIGMGLIIFVMILFLLLYFFPIFYLYKASANLLYAMRSSSEEAMTEGFKFFKSHYKFMGIFMIVILSFYAIALLFGLAAMAMM